MIPALPSTQGLGIVGAPGDFSNLMTPDSLLAYCESRLRGLDTQIKTAFASQQRTNAIQEKLRGVLDKVNQFVTGGFGNKDSHLAFDLMGSIDWEARQVGLNTPEGQKLIALRNEVAGMVCCPPTDLIKILDDRPAVPGDADLTSGAYTKIWNHLNQGGDWSANGTTQDIINNQLKITSKVPDSVAKEQISSLANSVKGIQSELNAGAELGMIQLQALMSQRQTAVQMVTNMVQSLGDQMKGISANIGK